MKYSVIKRLAEANEVEVKIANICLEKTLHSRIRNVARNYFNNWRKLGWKYDYYVNFDRLGNNRQRRR